MQARLDRNPDAMRTRRETVEHPFGTIKMRMGATHFLMKTLPKVATEMALCVLTYNLTRVLNIVGVENLMEAICRISLTERMWDPNVDSGRHLFRNTCRARSEKNCSVQRSWAIQQPSQQLLAKIIFAQPRPEVAVRPQAKGATPISSRG